MIQLSASLLAADYARLGEEVLRAEQAGVDCFHFDMMDGHYVPNLALTPDHLRALRPFSSLPFYVHLEMDNPDEVLSKFTPLQAQLIIVHWNTLTNPHQTFNKIRSQGMKVGLALNPDEPLEKASRLFRELDLLLLLGVYPGFGGQPMQPGTQEKIAAARQIADQFDHRISIAVDGGVRTGNIISLVQAGADHIIMGTTLFQSNDMTATVRSIREAIEGSQHR